MKLHDPITFEAHRSRNREKLIYIANLAGWTLEEAIARDWEMSDIEIEDGVQIPTETPAPAAPKRRGRPPGKSTKPPESAALLNAVEFVSIVETEAFEYSQYASIKNNTIVAYSNVLSAGHPVAEQLNLCPQIEKLRAALMRCGKSLAITENNNQISIKGDKIRALVPCLAEPLAEIQPDMPVLTGDFDGLKEAFKAGCTVADEKADRPMFASLLLDPNTITATNGQVLLQYWHGIDGLPPATVLPKIFCQAVAAIKYKITGIGANWSNEKGFATSVTFWFENGSWLKTQCYEDRWQNFEQLLNIQTNPVAVYAGLFEAIQAVEAFCEDGGAVYFHAGTVASHRDMDAGAMYEVEGLPGGKIVHGRLCRQVAPFVKTIDLTTSPDRVYFFGGAEANPIRGVFMGMAGSQ